MAAGILILHNCITSIVLIVWDSLSELDVVIHTFQRGKSMVRPSPIRPGRTMQVSLQVLTSSYWHWSCTKSSNKHAHHNSQQMSYLVTWMMTLPASQQPNMDHPVGNLSPVAGLQAHASAQVLPLPCQSKNDVLSPQAMKLPPSSFWSSHQQCINKDGFYTSTQRNRLIKEACTALCGYCWEQGEPVSNTRKRVLAKMLYDLAPKSLGDPGTAHKKRPGVKSSCNMAMISGGGSWVCVLTSEVVMLILRPFRKQMDF